MNLRPLRLTGSKLEKLLELVSISANKNTIYGDKNPMVPYGVRLGTPALTARDLKEDDMHTVAKLLHDAIGIALRLQAVSGPKLVDFVALAKKDEATATLKAKVEAYAKKFHLPG